jgi:hypothetical protein
MGLPFEQQRLLFGWSKTTAEQMAMRYTHLDVSKIGDFLNQCGFGNDSITIQPDNT